MTRTDKTRTVAKISPDSGLVHWAWAQHGLWSQAADKLRRDLNRARMAALILTSAAAILAAAAAGPLRLSGDWQQVMVIGAGVCAALLAAIHALISPNRTQERMRARSISESLKSVVYVYLAGAAPYRGADRDAIFRRNLDSVLQDGADLSAHIIGLTAGSTDLPAVRDADSYLTERVEQQINRYYRPKSLALRRRAQIFRVVTTGLAVIAAGVSVADGIRHAGWVAWVPVLTTISGALLAEAAFQRYSVLAVEYARACTELERLVRDRRFAENHHQAADDAFVSAAERVISQQNEVWMARGLAAGEAAVLPQPPRIPNPG